MNNFKHESPKSNAFIPNKFNKVTQCKECLNIGLYEDCHPVKPCKHCGGVVKELGPALWVPARYKYIWVLVSKGYWEPPIIGKQQ